MKSASRYRVNIDEVALAGLTSRAMLLRMDFKGKNVVEISHETAAYLGLLSYPHLLKKINK